jgi:hypothetical protein
MRGEKKKTVDAGCWPDEGSATVVVDRKIAVHWLGLRSVGSLMVVCWDGTNVFNEHHDIMHP